nr:hypothetical protein [Tanacetum cinerariifolium]
MIEVVGSVWSDGEWLRNRGSGVTGCGGKYGRVTVVLKRGYDRDGVRVLLHISSEDLCRHIGNGRQFIIWLNLREIFKRSCLCIHGGRIYNDSMSILDVLKMADLFLGNNMMYKRIVVFAGGLNSRWIEALVTVANHNDKSHSSCSTRSHAIGYVTSGIV